MPGSADPGAIFQLNGAASSRERRAEAYELNTGIREIPPFPLVKKINGAGVAPDVIAAQLGCCTFGDAVLAADREVEAADRRGRGKPRSSPVVSLSSATGQRQERRA